MVLNEIEQTRIATQFLSELVECTKSFLRLADKGLVGFVNLETQWVVDMLNGNAILLQTLAQQHVLIAIVTKTLVEEMGCHRCTMNEKIGGMKILVRVLLATYCRMLLLVARLVHRAQVALDAPPYDNTATDYLALGS
jgi:hypothetical protein